ncbi:MAG: ECF transporter S component [Clostridia bacterium]|nr:ECF transporter S component [Clostridia bacterium]
MKKEKKQFFSARNITFLAVLTALVVVLQLFGSYIKIGSTPISFVLVPIILGGMLLGIWAGLFLGLLFGFMVLMTAIAGFDPFTLALLQMNPVMTVILCLLKGGAAGFVSAILFKIVKTKNKYAAIFVAAVAAPVINTGIFVGGGFIIVDTIKEVFNSFGTDLTGVSPIYIIFVLCVGVNFFIELAVNLICAPALYTVENVVENQILKKNSAKNNKEAVNNDNLS